MNWFQMAVELLKIKFFRMTTLNLNDFMKKNGLKNETMEESVLIRILDIKFYPRDSKLPLSKNFEILTIVAWEEQLGPVYT